MPYQVTTSVPASHHSLPGHFPDNPIVPGVVILDYVFSALQEWLGDIQLEAMPSVKFMEPIYPEDGFTITLEAVNEQRYSFTCQHNDRVKARGEFLIQPLSRT